MRALWLRDRVTSLLDDVPVPEPPPGEALVRVLRAGICRTDLELVRGYYPFDGVLGHEFVGVVEEGPAPLLGRRVVGEINATCGRCRACCAGRGTHCENRTVLGIVGRHGAFAEYLTLPTRNLHLVPDTISSDAATFTEPLAAALEIQQQVPVRPDDRVLVVGDGKLGQLVAQTLSLVGCDLLVLGRHERKLGLLQAEGIRTKLASAVAAGGEEPEDSSFDVAVECTGNAEGFAVARRALRARGVLVMKSTYAGRLTLDASALVVDELTLVGSRCGPFGPALRLLAEGLIEVTPMISASFPLGGAREALEYAERPGTLKVLLEVSAA
ncbi:MAG TPA: alcohol dehydrogenase catalytic domain-containing protein [Thermoanaerobaculia bacterium]|nr:alcohol dehydrogenase catalytic domain-containing protein [Thermoanaerobaculia bacterium]